MSETPFITKDGIEVVAGQVWRDCDPRNTTGRTLLVKERGTVSYIGKVRVVSLSLDGERREVGGARWLTVARMHKHARGYELVMS